MCRALYACIYVDTYKPLELMLQIHPSLVHIFYACARMHEYMHSCAEVCPFDECLNSGIPAHAHTCFVHSYAYTDTFPDVLKSYTFFCKTAVTHSHTHFTYTYTLCIHYTCTDVLRSAPSRIAAIAASSLITFTEQRTPKLV